MPRSPDSITDQLRDAIIDGTFEPGARLIEMQLTKRFGVGRATVRSAIVELDKEGLVERQANRGATVRKVTLEEIIETYEVRGILAGLISRLAAERASNGDRARLRNDVHQIAQAHEEKDFDRLWSIVLDMNVFLHTLANHTVANDIAATLNNRGRFDRARLEEIKLSSLKVLPKHYVIIEKIIDGDGNGAEHAVRDHMSTLLSVLREEWNGDRR